MRSLLTLLTVVFLFSCIISCKKSNSSASGGGSVQGNWKFLFLTAQTTATASASGLTDVTKSAYTTTGNAGTFAITADSMLITGLTYTASFNAVSYLYVGGTLLDSTSVPYSETIPVTTESAAYKQIGNDSLYFPAGGFSSIVGSGSTLAEGARYVINKDTLKMSVQASESMSGVVGTVTETVYLLKQ